MVKRVFLFLLTNFLVIVTVGFLIQLFGLNGYLNDNGINYSHLLTFSAIIGFSGAFISLALSKTIAKAATGAKTLTAPYSEDEIRLLQDVKDLADKAGVSMPEVAIYSGTPNAFATGPHKNNALIAVSTELLQVMPPAQVKAVLAHEMSHIVNGDMVTMTLLQGILNTFVVFFARVAALLLQNRGNNDNRRRTGGITYYLCVQAFEIVFGILASIVACAFSRHREYRADAGAVKLLGTSAPMIDALKVLSMAKPKPLPSEMKAFGITDVPSFMTLFATHPPLSARIRALSSFAGPQKKNRAGGLFKDVAQ